MTLPRAEDAIIPVGKLRDYPLSFEHPVGRSKAGFFQRLGFRREEWHTLESALRSQLISGTVMEQPPTRYGRRFVVTGQLQGPARVTTIRTVWIIRQGEDIPRFVTALPGGRP